MKYRGILFLAATAAALVAALHAPALAADAAWPTKPVRLIVPAPAGVTPDLAARQLAERLAVALGQQVFVENKPGAGGTIGMLAAARSPPDGYTLVLATYVPLTVNPSLYPHLPYDPVKDFAPVTLLYQAHGVLVARPDLGVNSLAEFIQLAKARPGQIFYGSGGSGTPPHMTMELLKFAAGIDLVHVPYSQGAGPVMGALLAGDVSVVQEGANVVLPYIQNGKLKPLAVTGEHRIAALPEVPTFGEAGIAGIPSNWAGILVPAGTPSGIVQRLQQEIARAAESPEMQSGAERGGRTIRVSTPDEMARLIAYDIPKWRALIKRAGLKPD